MQTRKKLLISLLALLIAFVLMAVASMAWMTLSTNPESSGIEFRLYTNRTLLVSADGVNFSESMDISDKFANFVPLHPVSTIDGIHWFIPTYNPDGSLRPPSEFIMDDDLYYANVMNIKTDIDGNPILTDDQVTPLSGRELVDAENRGYYVYGDIWLKSEEENGCRVRLSIPHTVNRADLNGMYGTYVLPMYELTNEDGVKTLSNISNNVESSIRIGFLVMDGSEGDTAKENEKFVIFEANADHRSLISTEAITDYKKPEGAGAYIHNYAYDSSSYLEERYIKTQPLGYTTGTVEAYTKYTDYSGGEPSDLYLKIGNVYYLLQWNDLTSTLFIEISGEPKTVSFNSSTGFFSVNGLNNLSVYTKSMVPKVEPVPIPPDQLIVQLAGKWNETALEQALDQEGQVVLDSTVIATGEENETGYFGKFLKTQTEDGPFGDGGDNFFEITGYSSLQDIAGDTLIIDLADTEPVRIRIFVWIEGQDADCWNDITSGVFRVNLELAGESK